MPTHEFLFHTWGQLIEQATQAPSSIPMNERRSRDGGESRWFGGTWENAAELLVSGWEKGAADAKALSAPLFESVSSIIERQELFYDVEGHGLDIGRYVDNEPECWQRYEHRHVEGTGHKVLRVVVSPTAHAAVSAEIMTARGSAVHSLINLLEYAGHRCEVWAIYCQRNWNANGVDLKVLVKSADQNIEDGRMAFAMSHPSMLRRIAFSTWETAPQEVVRVSDIPGGYGRPHDTDEVEGKKADIYIGAMAWDKVNWRDADKARQWVMDELERQGVKLNKEALKA